MNTVIDVSQAELAFKPAIKNLYQLYQHDLSEFGDQKAGLDGLFDITRYFNAYWTDGDRFPFVCRVQSKICGFALVRRLQVDLFSIAEFFVMRGYRGTGVGKHFAFALFNSFRGNWSVAQEEENVSAQLFWKKVIGEYTRDNFREAYSASQPKGPKLVFSNFQ